MEREIKFRGWNFRHNRWEYGLYVNDVLYPNSRTSHRISPSNWEVDEKSIGQFTGLKDKNGKEIYEGDILQLKYYNVYKKWWSNTEEIPAIEADCEKQRADVKTKITTVVFDSGGFILKNGYPITNFDIAQGERFKRGQSTHCDTEERQWDFEVIGNIYENEDLIY